MQEPRTPAQWRFPPTGGGAETGSSPGMEHFSTDRIGKMVRETLQNSLDHPEDGLPGVRVTYRHMRIPRESVGADGLLRHAIMCLKEAKDNFDEEKVKTYTDAVSALEKQEIDCLAVVDENTSGLTDDNWRNLIIREGFSANGQDLVTGGSFGFGKNAPFNLSNCLTVIYSTRYLPNGKERRKGRVTKMIGKSQMITHWSDETGERMQGTGFYAVNGYADTPLEGPDIPEEFLPKATGTGIFIIGFHPEDNLWPYEIAEATVRDFFTAVHREKLEVHIDNGEETRVIDNNTLEDEISKLDGKAPTKHYYRALLEEPKMTEPAKTLEGTGSIKIRLTVGDESLPNRLAHVNARGMLITDGAARGDNPLHPLGGAKWGPWCAVTETAADRTERFLRKLEPPAHDRITVARLNGKDSQAQARIELNRHRKDIERIVKEALGEYADSLSEYVGELAEVLLGTELEEERTASVSRKKEGKSSASQVEIEGEEIEDDEGGGNGKKPPPGGGNGGGGTGGTGGTGGGNGGNGGTGGRTGKPAVSMTNARVLKRSGNEFGINFRMGETGKAVFSISKAGEQRIRKEVAVRAASARNTGDMTATVEAKTGESR